MVCERSTMSSGISARRWDGIGRWETATASSALPPRSTNTGSRIRSIGSFCTGWPRAARCRPRSIPWWMVGRAVSNRPRLACWVTSRPSQRSITEALALAESTGDPFLWGRALLGSALVCGLANDHRQKLELCQKAIPYFESIGANNYLGLMMVEIGRAHQKLGESESAADSIDRGIALMRTTGDDWALGMTTWMRGDHRNGGNDHSLAATMYRESIQLSWRTNDDCTVLFCMSGLVKLALQAETPSEQPA